MEPRFTQFKRAFMLIFLPDFILETFASQVTVKGFVSPDCVFFSTLSVFILFVLVPGTCVPG